MKRAGCHSNKLASEEQPLKSRPVPNKWLYKGEAIAGSE
jgi:hypothetical protein